jgi:hypothetical protein
LPTPAVPDTAEITTVTGRDRTTTDAAASSASSCAVRPANPATAKGSCAGATADSPAVAASADGIVTARA